MLKNCIPLENDKAKTVEMAIKIMKKLTKQEQISLICAFANLFIDGLGTDERFEIVQEDIRTKKKRKLVFSREDYEK